METLRRSGGQIALFVLALIGVGISIYLTITHYNHTLPVCSNTGIINCADVLTSHYSTVPGTAIPISVPGLGWFVVSAILAALAWLVRPDWRALRIAQVAWGALGLVTILYLVYVELVKLHAICVWCTSLHVTILVMFLISLVLLQQTTLEEDDFVEEDETPTPLVSSKQR